MIHLAQNSGYGALKAGIRRARGELVAITDADGTYPHAELPALIALASDADMVVGARTGEGVQYPWLRRIPKLFLRRWLELLAGQRIPDMNSGMRVFRRELALRFLQLLPDGFSFTSTITLGGRWA